MCTIRSRSNNRLPERFKDRFTAITSLDADYCWVEPATVKRCDTIKAGRTCWLQLEEQAAKLRRLRRSPPVTVDENPQFRLARILHSSLNETDPGSSRMNVPLRFRLSRLSDQHQSPPDLYGPRSSLSPISAYPDRNTELILTAL